MARYIDAGVLIGKLVSEKHFYPAIVARAIDDTPTADVVEVKHGENIGTLHPVDEFICSECGIVLEGWTKVVTDEDDGEMYFYEYEFKYCPNCGAKMDRGVQE